MDELSHLPARHAWRSLLSNDAISPLFLAVIEATEEAVYNSLFRATTVTGRGRTVEALLSSGPWKCSAGVVWSYQTSYWTIGTAIVTLMRLLSANCVLTGH